MNLFYFLPFCFPFLDLAPIGPVINHGTTSPETKAIIIGLLVVFLAFVGYLIWKAIKNKRDGE